jgi:hypothetical protein
MGSALVLFERPRIFNIGKPRISKLGPLSDISQGGLSVEYFAGRKRFGDFCELSILVPGHGITVYRIPFRNISDVVVAELDAKRIIMRRGIQFDELNPNHTERLKRFINLYTREEVPDRRSGFERRIVNHSRDFFAATRDRRDDPKKDRRKGLVEC